MLPNPIPELAPQLKQVRLSGILDSLETRNRQALEGKLAYTEFLAILIGDEIARRESKTFAMRLRRAQFRTTKTLEQFDFDRIPKLNCQLVHELASGRYLNEKAPVLIVGPSGIGKSLGLGTRPLRAARCARDWTWPSRPAPRSRRTSMPPAPPAATSASSPRSRASHCW